MSFLDKLRGKTNPQEDTTAAKNSTPPVAGINAAQEEKTIMADTKLVAVITAAIEAFVGEGARGNLVIRRISRASAYTTTWNAAGYADLMGSRRQ